MMAGADSAAYKRFREGVGDYQLASIAWVNEGKDLAITFRTRDPQESPRVAFRFVWVTNLLIRLDFQDLFCFALVFESSIEPDGAGYRVVIDFAGAPDGEIAFNCNGVEMGDA